MRILKWRTHTKVLKLVLEIAGIDLDRELIRGLFKGIVEPDTLPDYDIKRKRFVKQHDRSIIKLVKYYLKLAIYLYNRGEIEKAGIALGRAIHYAQDLVLKRRAYIIFDIHDKLEKEIDKYCMKIDRNFVLNCIEERPRRSNKPEDALCYAISITYRLLKAFREGIDRKNLLRKFIIPLTVTTILTSYLYILSIHLNNTIILASLIIILASILYIVLVVRSFIRRPFCKRFRTVM